MQQPPRTAQCASTNLSVDFTSEGSKDAIMQSPATLHVTNPASMQTPRHLYCTSHLNALVHPIALYAHQ